MDNLFRHEAVEHNRKKLEGDISLVQPPTFKYLTILITLIVLLSFLFLVTGTYSRKERAIGSLQPVKGVVKLVAPKSGVVEDMAVSEGSKVEKGDTILSIRSEVFGESGQELNKSLIKQYEFQINALNMQIESEKQQNAIKISDLNSRLESLKVEYDQVLKSKKLLNQRVAINKDIKKQVGQLLDTGYISELELKRQDDSVLALQQQLINLDTDLLSVIRQIQDTESQLSNLPLQYKEKLRQLARQQEELKLQLSQAKQERVASIVAPIGGMISGSLTANGNTVKANQPLVNIIPENSKLIAELYIPTSAIGFVEKGQSVKMRYKAFPYEKFGSYLGVIIEVSNTVLLPSEVVSTIKVSAPSYRVKVEVDNQSIIAFGKEIPLRSGMELDADIVIEERSFLQWLFDPIFTSKG